MANHTITTALDDLDAYSVLWHRARATPHADAITIGLITPHELRTGETPDELRARLAINPFASPLPRRTTGAPRRHEVDPDV